MDTAVVVALIGAVPLTLTSVGAFRAGRSARAAVDAAPDATQMDRIEAKIDDCLTWQGHHDAQHRRHDLARTHR